MIPWNIGDGAQHRIEHNGTPHLGGAVGARKLMIVVGEERNGRTADCSQWGGVFGRRRQYAVRDHLVFVKQTRVV